MSDRTEAKALRSIFGPDVKLYPEGSSLYRWVEEQWVEPTPRTYTRPFVDPVEWEREQRLNSQIDVRRWNEHGQATPCSPPQEADLTDDSFGQAAPAGR